LVLAARSERELVATARGLVRRGIAVQVVVCDVRDPAQAAALVAAAVRRFRRLDIVVNNAGIFRMAPVASTEDGMWRDVLATNLDGVFYVTRAALPHVRRARGQFVNVVSIAGRQVFPGNAAYCASKWGVLGFTNVLREEVRAAGVRVSAVLPGPVDTPAWDGAAGRWNRARMLRPVTVARAIAQACTQPPGACLDEIVLTPVAGAQ
jgi:NAD(P)-dependent dehydrogenase (short-subunit alcohol dehydrogenase family)